MAKFNKDAGAALVFGVLYLGLWLWMATGFLTGRYKLRSRWTLLAFHVTVRVASQGLGVAFGMLGFANINVFVAYLILNAEGLFTITLAAYLFLKAWQKHNWGDSWLASDRYKVEGRRVGPGFGLLGSLLQPWKYRHHLLAPIHAVLIPANVMIIVGGVLVSNSYDVTDAQPLTTVTDQESTSKILRTVGSAIFLASVVLFNGCVYASIFNSQTSKRRGTHTTLFILAIVAVALVVRATFGLLQSCLYSLSYLNPGNYVLMGNTQGFTNSFTAWEYCLIVLPEFMCASLLNLSYFFNKQDKYPTSADIPSDLSQGQEIPVQKYTSGPMTPDEEVKEYDARGYFNRV